MESTVESSQSLESTVEPSQSFNWWKILGLILFLFLIALTIGLLFWKGYLPVSLPVTSPSPSNNGQVGIVSVPSAPSDLSTQILNILIQQQQSYTDLLKKNILTMQTDFINIQNYNTQIISLAAQDTTNNPIIASYVTQSNYYLTNAQNIINTPTQNSINLSNSLENVPKNILNSELLPSNVSPSTLPTNLSVGTI